MGCVRPVLICGVRGLQEPSTEGGGWVLNQDVIIRTYLRGWFTIDLLSILPFWVVPFVTDSSSTEEVSSALNLTTQVDEDDSSALGVLRIVRIIRLFRLLKLARSAVAHPTLRPRAPLYNRRVCAFPDSGAFCLPSYP